MSILKRRWDGAFQGAGKGVGLPEHRPETPVCTSSQHLVQTSTWPSTLSVVIEWPLLFGQIDVFSACIQEKRWYDCLQGSCGFYYSCLEDLC